MSEFEYPEDVLEEPEQEPDDVRPTNDSEDLTADVEDEESRRPPSGS
ncbi:MAG TPA: hypothetical protein VHX88_05710 [Solirubrobacteraceae bacterium]|jgi:hypothetical protein|nr:hypothetical protein [Solirubrobacteraceae bacterium]